MTDGDNRVQFGNWLQEQLNRRGWNRSALADMLDVPRGTVTRWLKAQRRIDDDHARRVARALGVDERIALYHAGYLGDDYPVELEIMDELRGVQRRLDNVRDIEGRLDQRTKRVAVWGRVPAGNIGYSQDEELEPVDVVVSSLRGARSPFGLVIVGDCMVSLGMFPNDIVICERDTERKPQDRELVVIRAGDGVTFKRWCVVNAQTIELRDADERVAMILNPIIDDYTIEGFYVTFVPLAPR